MAHVMTTPRDELHSVTDWKAGVWAGLIAGVVFLVLEMGMVWLFMGESPWGPPRMIAAIVLGKDVLPMPPEPATFAMGVVMAAMAVHFTLSILYGLIGAWLVHRFDWLGGLSIGAAFGLALYLVNFHLIAPAAFPWFTMAQNWISVFAHVIFGTVLGACYITLRKPKARRT